MEKLIIGIDDGLIGDSLTAFPALIELSKSTSFDLWLKNKQVRSLWAKPDVRILDQEPDQYDRFNVLLPFRKFAFSGLHVVQGWFDNFGLPIPAAWAPPDINVLKTEELDDVFDVVICPFSRSGGGGLKIVSFHKWDRVISTLAAAGLRVAVAGCFSDEVDAEFWTDERVVKFDTMPLPELSGRLLAARCTVTIDTGLGHLAHLLGVPHVHLIPKHPNLPPRQWVNNRNDNADVIFEKFSTISVDKILFHIFRVLERFNRAEYLESNKDFESQPHFYSKRLMAWQHYRLFGEKEGRKIRSGDRDVVPGWHDDLFRDDDNLNTKDIFDSFMSVGDNCEFGLIQRHFGSEPLDLLRWMTVPVDPLCELFRTKFERFGDADSVDLEDHGGEYVIHERNYDLFGHSFVRVSDAEYEQFLLEIRKRFRFLKRKMLDDIDEGARVLVYKSNNPLASDKIVELFRSVQSVTKCPLLVVQAATSAHEVGKVARSPDGPLVGFVERFAPYDGAFDISPPSWLAVAWETLDILRGTAGRGVADGRSAEDPVALKSAAAQLDVDLADVVPETSGDLTSLNVLVLGSQESITDTTRSEVVRRSSDGCQCAIDLDGVHGVSEVVLVVDGFGVGAGRPESLFTVELGTSETDFERLRFHALRSGDESDGASGLVFRTTMPVLCRFIRIAWREPSAAGVRSAEVRLDDEPLLALGSALVL